MAAPITASKKAAIGKDAYWLFPSCASLAAPTALEINSASGLNITGFILAEQEGFDGSTNKVTLPSAARGDHDPAGARPDRHRPAGLPGRLRPAGRCGGERQEVLGAGEGRLHRLHRAPPERRLQRQRRGVGRTVRGRGGHLDDHRDPEQVGLRRDRDLHLPGVDGPRAFKFNVAVV
jgi:hypothetical protein